MSHQPKRQSSSIDVVDWEIDAEFGVYPQGARAKDALFAPPDAHPDVISHDRRYLFKRSRKNYPDQFWCEVVAYRIGCLLGVEVPPAFAAWNSATGHCAALIEWFYVDGESVLVHAGDFLLKVQPDFDRKQGTRHNLHHNSVLTRALSQKSRLQTEWRQWWVDALLFDALIGNTDRHQDNWGFIRGHADMRLSPYFDNGTSLGHERFPERVTDWTAERLDLYISRGTHHVKWSLHDPINGHFDLLSKALGEWPETREVAAKRLNFGMQELTMALIDLLELNLPVPLSKERLAWMLTLTRHRLERLIALFR